MSKLAKHFLFGAALLASASASAADAALKVYDVDVTVNNPAGTLDLVLDLYLKDFKLGQNGEAVYTPVVISQDGSQSVTLSPFTVAGRNQWYHYQWENSPVHGTVYRAGSKETVQIKESTPLLPWMLEGATVEVRQQSASCCKKLKTLPGDSEWGNLLVARLHNPEPQLKLDYVFSPPMEDEPVRKSVEGSAFVTFVVNRTELNPDYMDNPKELRKITNSIDFVKSDPDAIITEVHIRGYASPEGAYSNNVRLAQGRTQTLAGYVNSLYKFEPGIMTTSYDPEDWTGLRAYVADSMNYNLTDRKGLLEIIDGPLDFDARDAALKNRFPKDYQVLLKEIYPWLRHSDYAVKYQIKVYTDLANLNRIYKEDPTKLRAVDFYTIAQQYPTGSPEYLAVMKKALDVYPDHPMINLNVANLYMEEGKFDAARSCLLKAGQSPQANYARGVLAAKQGDWSEAEKWFAIAAEGGIPAAAGYVEEIKNASMATPVEILVKTTKIN